MPNIIEKLKQKKVLLCDGAWGTFLLNKGLKTDECPEYWNINHRNYVYDIAKSYINAGSDIIETNSFGANRFKLSNYNLEKQVHYNLQQQVYFINKNAAQISRKAVGDDKYVAGSIGPTGKMLLMGDVSEEELYEAFKEQAMALENGGADIILIETMSALDEALIAIKSAKENTKCVIAATMTFDKIEEVGYRTIMGISPEEMLTSFKNASVDIIGSNCGNGIEDMIEIVKILRNLDKDIPILAQPNAGLPEYVDGKTVYKDSPYVIAAFVPSLIEAGANIIGGCCGTTPEHIKEFRKMINFLNY